MTPNRTLLAEASLVEHWEVDEWCLFDSFHLLPGAGLMMFHRPVFGLNSYSNLNI